MTEPLADAAARVAALDPERSFIVQAPAGSGKTGLLTQRFLCLLARVDHPEEVVAVTFTRKAAAEMRDRVLAALAAAARGVAPEEAHGRQTRILGETALQRDQHRGWRLLENPGRLRIVTIDALCATIARQMPVVSGLGGMPAMSDDPGALYRAAARRALDSLEEGGGWSEPTAVLLDHLDNNRTQAEAMLANMLARREQWLRHVVGGGAGQERRERLEAALARAVAAGLAQVAATVPAGLRDELSALAGYAAANLREAGGDNPLAAWLDGPGFPDGDPASLPLWRGLRTLLLTGEGSWRRQVDKRIGFPPGSGAAEKADCKRMKGRVVDLLARLGESPGCLAALQGVEKLPEPAYTAAQWRILDALLTLLPMAVAQLLVLFGDQGVADFAEMAQAAQNALGDADSPTDLALRLDYGLKHVLVDEFQDTSQGQFRLLQRLTAGWSGEDGRTLFLVGDPMQSIYRFREAEVGLFLKARREGIGQVALEPLRLEVNFRSRQGMVDWVNGHFGQVLAPREDGGEGAVPFSASVPFHPPGDAQPVTVHPRLSRDDAAEAEAVVRLATAARQRGESVAILGRARPHLTAIVAALTRHGQRYQGVEIESLAGRVIIQDLLALTRALTHPADRIAWLAVLRAPWCGLSLRDLLRLAPAEAPETVWECLADAGRIRRLSPDGQERLARVAGVLYAHGWMGRRRSGAFPGGDTLRAWVEGVWERLGGPAVAGGGSDLDDARVFFSLLAAMERGGELPDFSEFRERVAQLFAAVDPEGDPGLQLMTIHKAKGLEFDTVILPGLGRRSGRDDPPLLAWMAQPDGLLLAPVKRSDHTRADPIHDYLRWLEKRRGEHETGRLLYVAATRARRRLHLLGHVREGRDGVRPEAGSLLDRLWPTLSTTFEAAIDREGGAAVGEEASGTASGAPGTAWRLPSAWRLPEPPPGVRTSSPPAAVLEEPVPFEWAGEMARLTGMAAHRLLRVMAAEGLERWDEQAVRDHLPAIRAHLLHLGAPRQRLEEAARRVERGLLATLADPRGRWILDHRHRQGRSEYALSGLLDGRLVRVVMDRTFVDDQGVRWIIDFKTSEHGGGDVAGFLDNERLRYQDQMARYGLLMANLDARPIRLGLYFPLLGGWREWSLGEEGTRT